MKQKKVHPKHYILMVCFLLLLVLAVIGGKMAAEAVSEQKEWLTASGGLSVGRCSSLSTCRILFS